MYQKKEERKYLLKSPSYSRVNTYSRPPTSTMHTSTCAATNDDGLVLKANCNDQKLDRIRKKVTPNFQRGGAEDNC